MPMAKNHTIGTKQCETACWVLFVLLPVSLGTDVGQNLARLGKVQKSGPLWLLLRPLNPKREARKPCSIVWCQRMKWSQHRLQPLPAVWLSCPQLRAKKTYVSEVMPTWPVFSSASPSRCRWCSGRSWFWCWANTGWLPCRWESGLPWRSRWRWEWRTCGTDWSSPTASPLCSAENPDCGEQRATLLQRLQW